MVIIKESMSFLMTVELKPCNKQKIMSPWRNKIVSNVRLQQRLLVLSNVYAALFFMGTARMQLSTP